MQEYITPVKINKTMIDNNGITSINSLQSHFCNTCTYTEMDGTNQDNSEVKLSSSENQKLIVLGFCKQVTEEHKITPRPPHTNNPKVKNMVKEYLPN